MCLTNKMSKEFFQLRIGKMGNIATKTFEIKHEHN